MPFIIHSKFDSLFPHFQITTSVLLVLIIVITMQHVLIRMDRLLALVTLDTVEMELTARVLSHVRIFLLLMF